MERVVPMRVPGPVSPHEHDSIAGIQEHLCGAGSNGAGGGRVLALVSQSYVADPVSCCTEPPWLSASLVVKGDTEVPCAIREWREVAGIVGFRCGVDP